MKQIIAYQVSNDLCFNDFVILLSAIMLIDASNCSYSVFISRSCLPTFIVKSKNVFLMSTLSRDVHIWSIDLRDVIRLTTSNLLDRV